MNYIHQVEPYITENEAQAAKEYLCSDGWLTEFKETKKLEKRIEDFLDVKHAIMVTSGTVALYLAIKALDLDGKIIVPDYTMIASPNAVKWANAEVELVDIDKDNMCLSQDRLNSDVQAVLYVSINGRGGSIRKVSRFCEKNNLYLIEDACQSFGSRVGSQYLGTLGDIGVFSLSPHKIITTGQGGIVVTNNDENFEKVRKLKNFSRTKPGVDQHTGIGYNFKFTDLQAVIGFEQLKTIEWRIKQKRSLYNFYRNELATIPFLDFLPFNFSEEVPWFVDVILGDINRKNLISYLENKDIGTRQFYPPIHSQEPYPDGDFPNAVEMARRGLWLPSSVDLTFEQLNFIVEAIKNFK